MNNHLIDENWKEKFIEASMNKPVENIWGMFKTKMIQVRDKFVATRSGIPKWRDKGDIPINKSLQDAIKEKTRLHRRWISNRNNLDHDIHRRSYKRIRNKVKGMMRKTKRKLEKDIANRSKHCPKVFWSYVRNKLKTKSGVSLFSKISLTKHRQSLMTKKKLTSFKINSQVYSRKNQTANSQILIQGLLIISQISKSPLKW